MASQAIIANQRSLGGGGSGIKINASVLPVLPSAATDGMIIVVSSTPANQFYFGYTMPPSPVAGDVWIQTIDTALGYPFLIGTVTLKPGATMQYTGSIWEYRNAYLGLGGKWEIFSTFSPLSALTWEQIDSIASSGEDLTKFFSIGDTKPFFYAGTATQHEMEIIDFYHDDLADDSGKAGITFCMKDCLDTTYPMHSVYGGSTAGGWGSANFRTGKLPDILANFPADMKDVAKPVYKKSSVGYDDYSRIGIWTDAFFVLSEEEVFGEATYQGEGSHYLRFSTKEARIKNINGTAAIWWTRSPASKSSYVAVPIDPVSRTTESMQNYCGIALAFCV